MKGNELDKSQSRLRLTTELPEYSFLGYKAVTPPIAVSTFSIETRTTKKGIMEEYVYLDPKKGEPSLGARIHYLEDQEEKTIVLTLKNAALLCKTIDPEQIPQFLLKVKRSNGEIEDDWIYDYEAPDWNGVRRISLTKEVGDITLNKIVSVEDIVSLNGMKTVDL